MNKPSISIIIPLFNKKSTIKRALDSVFSQTFTDYEIIVVDDGSTDGGTVLVEEIRDERLRLIKQQNVGPGSARNRGVQESSGKYLAFLDADDEWMPDILAEALVIFSKHKGIAFVAFDIIMTDNYANTRRKKDLVKSCPSNGRYKIKNTVSPTVFSNLISFMTSISLVITRADFISAGGFYDKNRCICGEDEYLWIKLALNYDFYIEKTEKAIYHIENSDLGYNLRLNSVQAALIDPGGLLAMCPNHNIYILKGLLAVRATTTVIKYAKIKGKRLQWLLDDFCSEYIPPRYILARFCLLVAPVLPSIRRLTLYLRKVRMSC